MPHKQVKNKRGQDIPSVTEIIGILDKPFLRFWYGNLGTEECEKIKRESAAFGTKIHAEVSKYLTDGLLYDEQSFLTQSFSRHWADSGYKLVEVEPEEPYVSEKYDYQGTFDWVEREPSGELVMADLKVTSQMQKEYGLQLSAYANLYNEKHGTKITKGRIYRIDKKTGRLQIKDFDNLPKYFKVFKCLIPVAKWLKGE